MRANPMPGLHVNRVWLALLLLTAALPVGSIRAESTADGPLPLVDAVERKQWSQVTTLLASSADVNATQPDGMTALHWAVLHGRPELVSELLAAGAAADPETEYGVTPLAIACQHGDGASVRHLLERGADPTRELPGGETLLMTAARTGAVEPLRLLLARGVDVNAQERNHQTALMWAADAGNNAAVEVLLAAKADANQTSRGGFTAFFFAARSGRSDVCATLLKAGVDVNAVISSPGKTGGKGRRPRDEMSALMLAVESGHFELAIELVRAGANPNDVRSGAGPLHALSWVRKPNSGDNADGDPSPRGSGRFTSLDFVREIVALGGDVNLALPDTVKDDARLNPIGATPLMFAAKTADAPYLRLLVELGADPLQPNVDGCTPLMAAAGVGVRSVDEEAGTESEVLEALEFLRSLGADVNTVDADNETAMHGAAYRSFPQVALYLAEHGADPAIWNKKNKSRWTPFDIADGKRPGSVKPSPEMKAALQQAVKIHAQSAAD